MKKISLFIIILTCLIFISGCTKKEPQASPEQVYTKYLEALKAEKWDDAMKLFSKEQRRKFSGLGKQKRESAFKLAGVFAPIDVEVVGKEEGEKTAHLWFKGKVMKLKVKIDTDTEGKPMVDGAKLRKENQKKEYRDVDISVIFRKEGGRWKIEKISSERPPSKSKHPVKVLH
ncbi:MAG: hypothetical protein K8T10_03160 [Candidatus Eremiobacteraeota bacterium]|nr:hypothetical protein [Candidatus Eremiobacteraeota bacterium]